MSAFNLLKKQTAPSRSHGLGYYLQRKYKLTAIITEIPP